MVKGSRNGVTHCGPMGSDLGAGDGFRTMTKAKAEARSYQGGAGGYGRWSGGKCFGVRYLTAKFVM